MLKYSDSLNCLLIQTKFSDYNYWNFSKTTKMTGAKAMAPPLGLLTVAALLPQSWNFKILDINAEEFDESKWHWADLVCVGGMLPQQTDMLKIIRRAKAEGKFVAVGGADPSAQPDIYSEADALILDEGEVTIPMWLEAFKNGQPYGIIRSSQRADLTKSPAPRYDLINVVDYYELSLQSSRGCPFNCEFCDIVEIFGRKYLTKTVDQVLSELDALYKTGHRGHLDIVDDNFIGDIRFLKEELLPALIVWNKKRGYPFYFSVEVSLNLAEHKQVLKQMQAAGFRQVFIGIETPDADVLRQTNKKVNSIGSIADRVAVFHEYGLIPTAGFIMGFDGEKDGTDKMIIQLIEETCITMAMVGLLVALPRTQLTRRLKGEGRLLDFSGRRVKDEDVYAKSAKVEDLNATIPDQTVVGLNFITKRDRIKIISEFENVIETVYSAENYIDRIVRAIKRSKMRTKVYPSLRRLPKLLLGLFRLCFAMTLHSKARRPFWRAFWQCLFLGQVKFEMAMVFIGGYLHFAEQREFLLQCTHRNKLLTDPTGDN